MWDNDILYDVNVKRKKITDIQRGCRNTPSLTSYEFRNKHGITVKRKKIVSLHSFKTSHAKQSSFFLVEKCALCSLAAEYVARLGGNLFGVSLA
jgi:hypothetical protein